MDERRQPNQKITWLFYWLLNFFPLTERVKHLGERAHLFLLA